MVSIINWFLAKRRQTEAAESFLHGVRLKMHSADELEAKILEYQTSKYWEVVNVAVKLCGIARAQSFIPWLAQVATDLKQVGFVRRNAIAALGEIGEFTEPVKQTLLAGLTDHYWEVRSHSAWVLGLFPGPDKELVRALCAVLVGRDSAHSGNSLTNSLKLKEKNFEVRMHIAEALGNIGDRDALPALHLLLQDLNWQVRQAVMHSYITFYKRGLVTADEIKLELLDFDLAADGFRPWFEVPSTYNDLIEIIGAQKSSPDHKSAATNDPAVDPGSVRSR